MIVPGLPSSATATGSTVAYATSVMDVDVAADLGNPIAQIHVFVEVRSGVIIGSTASGIPGMDFTGLPAGSTVRLVNKGRISAKGGDGGRGGDDGTFHGGGGGGGAGTDPGLGGASTAPGIPGTDGTATVAGLHGDSDIDPPFSPVLSFELGEVGSDAISCGAIEITIHNASGEIWGGGGGGFGGFPLSTIDDSFGGDGGGLGLPGQDASSFLGAAGGYAVRGSNVTFVDGGSSPNVEGTVGV